jgi:hypothetical protein
MDRRRHAAGEPNPEEAGEIERLVRDEQNDRLVRRACSRSQRRRQVAGGSIIPAAPSIWAPDAPVCDPNACRASSV